MACTPHTEMGEGLKTLEKNLLGRANILILEGDYVVGAIFLEGGGSNNFSGKWKIAYLSAQNNNIL